jgi:hypothetical protein
LNEATKVIVSMGVMAPILIALFFILRFLFKEETPDEEDEDG